jgi:hypothetical protein
MLLNTPFCNTIKWEMGCSLMPLFVLLSEPTPGDPERVAKGHFGWVCRPFPKVPLEDGLGHPNRPR